MGSLVRCEIRKAFCNRWFFIALAAGCMLAAISAISNALVDYEANLVGIEYLDSKWLDFSSSSCFKYWIVIDFIQPTTGLFFLLLPLLAVLPYAWSYLEERKSGYVGSVVVHTARIKYFFAKYIAVFLSGALAVAIPIVLNFLICACFMPARMPDVFAVIYFGIFEENLWSEVFYTNPFLYVALFTLLNFAFSGLWAVTVFALSGLLRNRVALTILPYLAWVFVDFVSDTVLQDVVDVELTPFGFLRGIGADHPADGGVIAVILAIMLIVSVIGTYVNSRRDIL